MRISRSGRSPSVSDVPAWLRWKWGRLRLSGWPQLRQASDPLLSSLEVEARPASPAAEALPETSLECSNESCGDGVTHQRGVQEQLRQPSLVASLADGRETTPGPHGHSM